MLLVAILTVGSSIPISSIAISSLLIPSIALGVVTPFFNASPLVITIHYFPIYKVGCRALFFKVRIVVLVKVYYCKTVVSSSPFSTVYLAN